MIKAPFNFVALPKKEYCPDWANEISHDIPFSDGVSGTISVKFTAESPVFLRNGHKKEDAPKDFDRRGRGDFPYFSNINGNYFLPGTSVKGMLRNVLEIMSYGKLRVDKNAMFAQREWGNFPLFPFVSSDKTNATEAQNNRKSICCGWLREKLEEDGPRYFVEKCSDYYRINHQRIDELLGMDLFEKAFGKHYIEKTAMQKLPEDNKTASYKYSLLQQAGIPSEKLKNITFKQDEIFACKYQENRVMCCNVDDEEALGEGTIVFTGQPDSTKWSKKRDKGDGKFYEFVFTNEVEHTIELSIEQYHNYRFIFSALPDWEELKEKMQTEGLPVFFREGYTNGKLAIKDLGLAFLYKLPYEQTPYHIEEKFRSYITDTNKENNYEATSQSPDMADCIFGYINNETKTSLKGRVQVSHFNCTKVEKCNEYRLILNSPKASYYPIYIQQTNGDNNGYVQGSYNTYNDGILSGWKRYNLRDQVWESYSADEKNKVDTYIQPLGKDSVFEGKIRFFNLKKVELGALLSAITFFGTKECQHQIGQAKPYGFGRISCSDIELKTLDSSDIMDANYYMALFEKHMNTVLDTKWHSSEPIVRLFTMAHTVIKDNEESHYMILTMKDKEKNIEARNDFQESKDNKEYLRNFSGLYGEYFFPDSKVSLVKETELKELVRELEQSYQDKNYSRTKELINKIDTEFQPDQSLKIQFDSYLKTIEESQKLEEASERVGNVLLGDYIAGAKYILPLCNKVLDWCLAQNASALEDQQIFEIEAKMQSIINETPDKKKANVKKDISKALDKLKNLLSETQIMRIKETFGL